MSEANKIDYTGVVNAARRGDEDAYEFLYNQSVQKCRAICMKYFDPATEAGRQKTDDVVREVYVRMYDRIKTLYDPEDFPILGRALTREVCLKKRKLESVQLETEAYIGVADAGKTEATPLVTAEECRAEVRGDAMLKNETVGTLVLAVLHRMTPAERLAIVNWNEDDPTAMKREDTLREAFICAEKTIMELEPEAGIRGDVPVPVETTEQSVSFESIWSEIRQQFYITNTIQLPSVLKAIGEDGEEDLAGDRFDGYLDEEDAENSETPSDGEPAVRPAPKKGFLGTWWGRLIVVLILIVLVLAAVVVTAGQHTSHALVPAFMQSADFTFEQAFGFNIS